MYHSVAEDYKRNTACEGEASSPQHFIIKIFKHTEKLKEL